MPSPFQWGTFNQQNKGTKEITKENPIHHVCTVIALTKLLGWLRPGICLNFNNRRTLAFSRQSNIAACTQSILLHALRTRINKVVPVLSQEVVLLLVTQPHSLVNGGNAVASSPPSSLR